MTASSAAELPLLLFVHGSAEMYGSDKVLLYLAQAVSRVGEFKPVVVLNERGPLHIALEAEGVEVHEGDVVKVNRAMLKPMAPWILMRRAWLACRDLDRIAAGRKIGLVHSNTLGVLGGAIWAWRRGHNHLWHIHEIILEPAAVRRALPLLARYLSQRIVSNSTSTQAWLFAQEPSLADRAVVVFNGLPDVPAPVPAATLAFRQLIGASAEDVVVTVAGRLNRWKGQGLLIDAIALLQREGRLDNLRLAVVGDVFPGYEHIKARLVAQVRLLGLEQRVRFVSFVSDIYAVWRGTQIAVVPSLEPEPFGMVAIEAMACAVPLVAAAHGGLLDIVCNEQTGLLFEPRNVRALADSIARLAIDPELRKLLGEAGAARQRLQFSLQRQVDQMHEIYRELSAR